MGEYATAIDIDAPPEVVFDHLTTADGWVAWMGQHAELDAVPGGRFAVDINGAPVRGTFVEIDRPRRVIVSWGVAGSEQHAPGTSVVEFTLTPRAGGTHLDLVHRGLPDAGMAGFARGWEHFTPRLRLAATGTELGSDDWVPEQPHLLR